MKKSFLLLMAFLTMSANMLADGLTATLQQGDKMTAYFGEDAFKQAYEAASDGAVITLSAGGFNSDIVIEKQITIIGAYAFSGKDTENTHVWSIQIGVDNVNIEGIYISTSLTLGHKDAISNCQIKRCWVESTLSANQTHTNTVVDQCVVKTETANAKGINYSIKNTTINKFGAKNTTDNMATITNCVVWQWTNGGSSGFYQPYAIYMNNILGNGTSGDYSMTADASSEFYHNAFVRVKENGYGVFKVLFPSGIDGGNITGENTDEFYNTNLYYSGLNTYPAWHPKDKWETAGMDGTWIGIYGGTGFSAYPGIPRIVSRTIDSFTDAEGKLNVKISAKAEP